MPKYVNFINICNLQVVATGMCYGHNAYFTSGWNIMDGSLVIISLVDIIMFLINDTTSRIFGILRVSEYNLQDVQKIQSLISSLACH